MAKLRNLLALMTVVLHLTALLLPATAYAASDHAVGPRADMYAQAHHQPQPDTLCCATAGGETPQVSNRFCANCAVSCAGMQATLEAVGPLPFAHSSTSHLALAEQTLRSAEPETSLRPPRTSS